MLRNAGVGRSKEYVSIQSYVTVHNVLLFFFLSGVVSLSASLQVTEVIQYIYS